MAAQIFRHQHRVSYAECTVGNHVYYGRYLDLLEEARGEFFRQVGCPLLTWQTQGTIFPVTECRLRYKAAARYDDLLSTELWLTELRGVRLSFAYRVVNQAQVEILQASTFHACAGLNEKPKRLPHELCSLLEAYLMPGSKPAIDRDLPSASQMVTSGGGPTAGEQETFP